MEWMEQNLISISTTHKLCNKGTNSRKCFPRRAFTHYTSLNIRRMFTFKMHDNSFSMYVASFDSHTWHTLARTDFALSLSGCSNGRLWWCTFKILPFLVGFCVLAAWILKCVTIKINYGTNKPLGCVKLQHTNRTEPCGQHLLLGESFFMVCGQHKHFSDYMHSHIITEWLSSSHAGLNSFCIQQLLLVNCSFA